MYKPSEKELLVIAEMRASGKPEGQAMAVILEAGMTPFVFDIVKKAAAEKVAPSDFIIALIMNALGSVHGIVKMAGIHKNPEDLEMLKTALAVEFLVKLESVGRTN